jgi:pyridinium-3,5-bisthiocarboxylic acid mononucleotide nickel chelatase
VTPTGAAILRHLSPTFSPKWPSSKLSATGTGFGHKGLPGIANMLRILAFETNDFRTEGGAVAVCVFEVDDQTPEDLAVALERLRALPDIFDVMQIAGLGKKARMAVQVQILARPERLDAVLDAVFSETTTLGVRWRLEQRHVLRRDYVETNVDGKVMRVKHAERPDGRTTKAEMDDLALLHGGRREREAMRRRLESTSDD